MPRKTHNKPLALEAPPRDDVLSPKTTDFYKGEGDYMKQGYLAVLLALLSFSNLSSGTTFVELQSSYLGDGWFHYRMKVPFDPFFRRADIGDFVITSFTNFSEYGPAPQDWTNQAPAANSAAWRYALPLSTQSRPFEREFWARSDEHTFRISTNALVLFSLVLVSDWFDYWAKKGVTTENIVGYAYFPCLIPCAPEMADGSSTNYTSILQILNHDLTLDSLAVTNGQVMGVRFSANFKSTVLLEGSVNNSQWTNIAYLWGNPGTTTWTTNVSLNDYGNFFRLELVAFDEHVTNLPPLNPVGAASAVEAQPIRQVAVDSEQVPTLSCVPVGDEMAVRFTGNAGVNYLVHAMDLKGNVLASRSVIGDGTEAEVRFDPKELPGSVWFKLQPAS